jgi:N-methylhydantoinase A
MTNHAGGHAARGFRVGIDIGGTFTDIVASGPDGEVHVRKVSSTPSDYSLGICDGLLALLREEAIRPEQIDIVVHATTVATNAVLEGKGARTGLITTRGFRDVLEFRRVRVPELYNLDYVKPRPLVARQHRLEVDERMGPAGEIRLPLDEASVRVAARRLKAEAIEAVAVCLLHSYANPLHEQRVGAVLREELGDSVFISCSYEILPEIREYERTSTTVVNAHLGPVMRAYLGRLVDRLAALGIGRSLHVMTSGGGQMSFQRAAIRPAALVESGPAAGVIAASRIARRLGLAEVITLDMGGTTAKAATVEHGVPTRTSEFEIGAGISLSSKLVKGAGYAIKLPFIDVSEIGAGGGSLLWFDKGGLMKAGPQSAASEPGPVCYGRGGTQATLTDCFLTLGYLNPDSLVGGGLRLQAQSARDAVGAQLAARLGTTPEQAAFGGLIVAVANMVRAVKSVSTYRGRDPRSHTMIAFGGNGPLVAAAIAAELSIRHVLIPCNPGVLSACGLLAADHEQELVRSRPGLMSDLDQPALEAEFAVLERQARDVMTAEGFADAEILISRHADLRYVGQAFELTVAADDASPDDISKAFHREHLATNGHMAESEAVELVNLRLAARVPTPDQGAPPAPAPVSESDRTRMAYFGPAFGLLETRILQRQHLAGQCLAGPLIIEEYDSTCVVPPGCHASLDEWRNIVIDMGQPA